MLATSIINKNTRPRRQVDELQSSADETRTMKTAMPWISLLLLMIAAEPQECNCNAFHKMLGGISGFASNLFPAGVPQVDSDSKIKDKTTDKPSAAARGARESSTNSGVGGINDDFESQCLLGRGVNMQSPPKVFFFSSADHSNQTLGCTTKTVISLGLGDEGSDMEGDPKDWKLDTGSIQRLLINSGSYNKSAPSYILVHGFLASWNGDTWMCKFKDSILNGTRANVFIVDWSGGSKPMLPIDYGAAVSNTKYVGRLLAKFILTILQKTGQEDATQFRMIGHSLGAHISGFVGYALAGTPLGQITGLDPAGPCFSSGFAQNSTRLSETGELSGGRKRLSPESANLVVALHTDAGRFGLNENCAHYDIYVNGGSSQPVCVGQSAMDRVDNLLKLHLMDAVNVMDTACSHSYGHDLINAHVSDSSEMKCHLIAYRCASWEAFKKGECGLTPKSEDMSRAIDALTMDSNVNALQLARAADEAATWNRLGESSDNPQSDEDDEYANGEGGETSIQSSIIPSQFIWEGLNKNWRHFMKTSPSKKSFCAFTYQLVVAAEQTTGQDLGKLYVDILLDKELGLVNVRPGGNPLSRLAQVSHKIRRDSQAYTQLSQVFKNLQDNVDQLDFYTALITFDAVSSEECRALVDSNVPKANRKRWYLCQAISRSDGARLWSTKQEYLERVKWVAMVYLSGPNATIRQRNSYLFEPDLSSVKKGKPEGARTKMRSDQKGLVDQIMGGVRGGVKCLASSVNPLLDSSCPAGSVNLKYSIPLKTVEDDKKEQALQV